MKTAYRVPQKSTSTQKAIQPTNQVKLQRFWCGGQSFMAYQLTNGQVVMSERQMTLQTAQKAQKEAQEFVTSHNLEAIRVVIPNRSLINAYPLATVVAFWSYLNSLQRLPEREKRLLSALLLEKPVREEPEQNKEVSVVELSQLSEQSHPVKRIQLQLDKHMQLTVLLLPTEECRIEKTEGLIAIGASPTWLLEMSSSPKKAESLRRKGFSGTTEICYYPTPEGVAEVETLSFDDWLTVWEYFANRGNTRSTALLKAIALESLSNRIDAALAGDFDNMKAS
jgi:hypothetical protein